MTSAKFLSENDVLGGKQTNRWKKFQFWDFWEHLLYEISDCAFKAKYHKQANYFISSNHTSLMSQA